MALRVIIPNQVTEDRPEALRLRDAERLRRYREYLDFYNGKHWQGQAGQRQRTRLVLNYARAIVDKGASYLLGRGINFAVAWTANPPAHPEPVEGRAGGLAVGSQELARQAERLLYQVYEDNDLDAADLHGALNAGVLGDAVFKVFWDQALERIRVVNVDPFCFFARWAGDDIGVLRQAELHYRLSPEDLASGQWSVASGRSPVPATDHRPPTTAHSVIERWTDRELVLLVDGQEARRGPNPYGFIPFVHVPNVQPPNELWGVSDLRDVIGLNRELNARMSDRSDIIRYHADPPVIFRGVTEHSDLAVGPGTVWDIPVDADVKLLEWHNQPTAVQEHLEWLFRALYEVAETPRTAFGDSGRLLSGVALEVELRPIIHKTLRKRVFWEAALRRRGRMILRLAQQHGLLSAQGDRLSALSIKVIWPPMVPRDDEAEVRNNVTLVAAGLRSYRSAMDALGEADPEAELQRVAEDRQTLPTLTPTLSQSERGSRSGSPPLPLGEGRGEGVPGERAQ